MSRIKRQIQDNLKEANEILEQFELEVREIPKETRQKYQGKLKTYKIEMKKVEEEFQSAMDVVQQIKSRQELIGATVAVDMYDDSENSALLESADRIERGTRRLQEANRVAIESEQIGADILSNLQKDRETINRTRARVRDTEFNLGESSRILSGMIRRALQNRVILYSIIGALAFFVLITIYIKLR